MAYFEVKSKPRLTFPTLTDSIVTFNSQYAGLPLKSHKIALTATQSGSGTPSPSNPRPISGYSEINIVAPSTNLWGGGYMLYTFRKMNLNSTFGYNEQELHYDAGAMSGYKVIIDGNFKSNTQYTIILSIKKSSEYTSTNLSVLYTDNTRQILNLPAESDATVKQTVVFTTIQNKTVKAITGANGISITYLYYNECCLLEGVKTADDFVPFNFFATIPIGSTVYGGEYDARTGVLTVTHGVVDLGVVGYTQQSTGVVTLNKNNIQSATGLNPKRTNDLDMLCSVFSTDNSTLSATTNGIRFNTDVLAENFASTFNGQQLVFELETPTTIQLPPCPIDTLEGENNIWADTGDTTLQYPKFG